MTIDRDAVRPLETWMTLPQAAARLGISRQALHNQISRGKLTMKDLRKIGTVLIVSKKWVDKATQSA